MGEGAILYTALEAYPTHPSLDVKPPPQTTNIDVYSYGVLVCEVTLREFPDPDHLREMKQNMRTNHVLLHTLVIKCTQLMPGIRPTMAAVLKDLETIRLRLWNYTCSTTIIMYVWIIWTCYECGTFVLLHVNWQSDNHDSKLELLNWLHTNIWEIKRYVIMCKLENNSCSFGMGMLITMNDFFDNVFKLHMWAAKQKVLTIINIVSTHSRYVQNHILQHLMVTIYCPVLYTLTHLTFACMLAYINAHVHDIYI